MNNSEILEVVKDFLDETNQTKKFIKWVEGLQLEEDEEFDLKEWASSEQ